MLSKTPILSTHRFANWGRWSGWDRGEFGVSFATRSSALRHRTGAPSATPVAAALTTQGVPFVLVTGYSEAQSSQPELQNAARVDKPVNHQDLVRALAHVLEAASRG